jgi:hypothetical protein
MAVIFQLVSNVAHWSTACEVNMNRISFILLMSLAMGGAYAQGTGGTTVSTDPAKAAAVEKHAEELKARQAKQDTPKATAAHTSTQKQKTKAKAKAPATHKSTTTKPATAPKS